MSNQEKELLEEQLGIKPMPIKSISVNEIILNKIQTANPYFKENKQAEAILKQSTITRLSNKEWLLKFPDNQALFKQRSIKVNITPLPLLDYLTAMGLVDYSFDVSLSQVIIDYISTGYVRYLTIGDNYDSNTDTLTISTYQEYRAETIIDLSKKDITDLAILIENVRHELILTRREVRRLDNESKPLTTFRNDPVVKIPSEALIKYIG